MEELQAMLKPGEKPLGMEAIKTFIKLFGNILKMRNLLSVFDQFQGMDLLSERDVQDYTSIYLDLRDAIVNPTNPKTDICDDIVFEMELVKQVEVSIDFILFLVEQYRKSHKQDGEIRVRISKAIDSSPDLRDKKELIDQFIEKLTPNSEVDAAWHLYVNAEKRRQFDAIVEEEHLKREQAVEFIENAYERGYVPEGGMELDGIMPPINPFDANANREGKIATVLEKLKVFFKRFSDISDGVFRSEEVTEIKKRSKKAQEIQMVPQGSMLEDVEADDDVRRLVHNMMELYEGTTIMNIVVECQKEYQERYFSMKTNDWRHLLRDYVRKVTERPELQEDEVFRYVMAG